MTLEIRSLTKQYNKHKAGLEAFSLTIDRGILGLLGPNGAGKSTLMKIIATISKPTQGTVYLDGVDIVRNPDCIRKVLGYLPQDFGVYGNLNAYEFLEYVAAMKGVGGKGLRERIAMLLEGLNLSADARRQIGTYSGGMKQRIGIAQALLNDPKVLLFDEPTVGLDPEERVRFRQLITQLAEDSIVVLSSHIVSDVESIADRVAIMRDGRLLAEGAQEELVQQVDGKIFEALVARTDLNDFKGRHKVTGTSRHEDRVLVRYRSEQQEASPDATAVQATLEDAYLFLTQRNT